MHKPRTLQPHSSLCDSVFLVQHILFVFIYSKTYFESVTERRALHHDLHRVRKPKPNRGEQPTPPSFQQPCRVKRSRSSQLDECCLLTTYLSLTPGTSRRGNRFNQRCCKVYRSCTSTEYPLLPRGVGPSRALAGGEASWVQVAERGVEPSRALAGGEASWVAEQGVEPSRVLAGGEASWVQVAERGVGPSRALAGGEASWVAERGVEPSRVLVTQLLRVGEVPVSRSQRCQACV